MTAHVSVFDLKRFAEERFSPEELPAFEGHLAACGDCSARLAKAATRELHARGLGALLIEAPLRSAPAAAALIAFAASVLFVISFGQGPLRFPVSHPPIAGEQHGSLPLALTPADAGMLLPDGTIAFFDGGGEQR